MNDIGEVIDYSEMGNRLEAIVPHIGSVLFCIAMFR
jgi:hypothetical protein